MWSYVCPSIRLRAQKMGAASAPLNLKRLHGAVVPSLEWGEEGIHFPGEARLLSVARIEGSRETMEAVARTSQWFVQGFVLAEPPEAPSSPSGPLVNHL